MQKTYHFIYYIILILFVAGCSETEKHDNKPQNNNDTLYTADAAMEIFSEDPERAINIIDSALLMGNVDRDLATMLKAKIYSQSNTVLKLDTARNMLEDLMESAYVEKPDNREMVLDLLVTTTRLQDDYEQCLRWATEKALLCREQGNETEALRTEAEIGVILVILGNEKEGIDKLDNVIASLDGKRHVDEMDACIIALKRKIQVMKKLGREEEVIPLANHIIDIISEYREHYTEYANNSYRLPTEKEEVEDYCDYYTAQAYGNLAHAYATLGTTKNTQALKLSKNQALKQASNYLALFEKSAYGQSLFGRITIAPTWCMLGQYDKMLATYDEMTAQMGDDTINQEYAMMLRGRAIAANARDNTAAASDYWQRYSELKDQLNQQLQEGKAHEYAARYQLQEERHKTEREKAIKNQLGSFATLLGIMFFLVAIFAILLIIQVHAIRKKNAVLSKEIKERINFEEKYQKLNHPQLNTKHSTLNTEHSTLNTEHSTLNTEEDSELFEQIRQIIVENKLYLDPQLDRQHLMELLHLPKENIGAAFSKGSQYPSLTAFLNELRLAHAAKLLLENPDMSVTDVAIASGFSTHTTFSRNFKERYALTPTEFRTK